MRYRFTLTPTSLQPVTDADNAAVFKAIPQQSWLLTPQAEGCYPAGLVRIKFNLTGEVKERVTGKLFYRQSDSTYNSTSYIWLSTDDDGFLNLQAKLPKDLSELTLVLYSTHAARLKPEVAITQLGAINRYLPRIWELVKFHIRHPRFIFLKFYKAYLLLRRGGIPALKARLFKRDNYPEWIARYDTITDSERQAMSGAISQFSYKPLISILLPVYNVSEVYLRKAIDSVRAQLYVNWELCIVDDNSPDPHIREVIKEYSEQDPRIKALFRGENGHISEATNTAASLASGEFYGFLDHDDELREHALYMVVKELQSHPQAQLIFSDEDKITPEGVRHDPYFKSDLNPELLLCHNCVCHFTVVRAETFKRLGGLRSEFNGAQDWDFALRVSEVVANNEIRHIPHVLYHWRVIDGSTAKETQAKPYVTEAQIAAVSQHLERVGDSGAKVEPIVELSMLRVRYKLPQLKPLVSLVVPTYNQHAILSKCVDGILNRTSYKELELIIVDNRSDDPESLNYLSKLSQRDSRVRILRDDGEFNFSRINNAATRIAGGSILGFINNDIEVIASDWLSEMVANVVRERVGGVGARLLFPNGTVQHAGVITGIGGVAGHQFKSHSINSLGYFCRAVLPQNLSAVTAACMLVKAELFRQVGGFDESQLAVAFNDIDLCLKIRAAGYLIVYTPYAELLHHESVSRGYEDTKEKRARFKREYKVMRQRWGEALLMDPYYNPNFSLEGVGYDLGVRRVALV